MLVLTRKVGETIAIGDHIRIKVVEVKGGKIRLGIEAPDDYRISREELLLKVRDENLLAAEWELDDFRKTINLISDRKES